MRRLRAALLPSIAAISMCWALAGTASAAPAGTTHFPDLQTVIPLDSFSVVQGTEGREFRYTHLVYNNGPGPLEIQPQYNPASGTYQGMQQLFTHNSAGVWSLVNEVRVPDAFEFHAAHGHFHFPLAAFGLYQVAPGGGVGAPVSISPKNGFCISDSYIYNTTVEHSGKFVGQQGSCAEPTTLRGLSVGGADEYDYRDPGQSIPFGGVPDGTYWFRAMTDPHNDFVESDESNNETDVLVTISNNKVTAGAAVHPDTTPPPVSMTAPTNGTFVSGAVGLTATSPASGVSRIEFVVDGVSVGTSADTVAPYHLTWNSASVADGEHWVEARATDSQGRVNTSAVVALNVSNAAPPPPPPPPGSLGIDSSSSADGRGTIAKTIQVSQAGDLMLAFVSSDGPSGGQTATVSGGGLSWSLVRRANARLGTSEVWKANGPLAAGPVTVTSTQSAGGFDQSMTVIAFAGAGGVGESSAASAATGAPSTNLTTTKAGSWVFGAGNDWDHATARTVAAGQMMRHEWIDAQSGDTFWTQSQVAPTAASGTVVPISDTAPTTDQWNLVAVEVIPSTAAPPPPPDETAPQVSVSDPVEGETVSGITALGAVAADNVGVTNVQFKVDGVPLGAPVSSPPFMTQWDTRTFAAGKHTITAEASDAAGNVGASAGVEVTVDNSAPPPAVITIDTQQFRHATGTLSSPGINAAGGDVLVAYVGFDGPNSGGGQAATVTGAGLTWTLVKRSNTQAGDAEIWSAKTSGPLSGAVVTATPEKAGYAGSLTVIAYKGAAGVGIAGAAGAPSGAPDIYLPGIGMGSWVFAVGNDWDHAVARTPAAGQVLQDQWLATTFGDSFWVQSTAAPNVAPGLVTIHDNAPTTDRWNYAAVEIVPAAATSQPGAPTLIATVPASPANQNSPKVVGSAPAGTTVRLYSSSDCSGTALATASATALEAGIEVSVGNDTTTNFRATATGAEGTSACSAPLTYVEDSTAPQTLIGTHPAALSTSATANFEFSGEDPGGSGVASFECRRDSTEASAWASCSSPRTYTALTDGAHRFEVRAIDRAGNTDTSPASFEWQINTTAPPPPATLALDKVVTTHQSTAGSTIAAPALTTSKPGELLLAMIASDGPSAGGQTISKVSGGGLTWTLRKRANAQAGTAEIWQAAAPAALTNTVITATRGKTGYQGAITIAAFSGADTGLSGAVGSGAAASGAPSASLVTTRAGAWVWAVGDDWDKAVARTLGPGQTLVDQFLASSGDTFWAQRRTEPTPVAGTTVAINDTAPTTDRWNLALAEVLPAPGP